MQSASSFTQKQFAYKKSGILNHEITKKINNFKLYSTDNTDINNDINNDVNDDNNELEKVKRKMSWPFEMYDAPEQLDGSLACDLGKNAYVYMSMYVCIYGAYYICMYVCMYANINACVYMYECTYMHIYTYI
jgi:hypothetical protein